MATELHVVSDGCPTGCGADVVLLLARRTAVVFAYCQLCGCTWAEPASAQFEAGLQEVTPLWVLAPYGVDFPGPNDMAAACLGPAILRTIAVNEWSTTLDELNSEIAREIAT